MDLSSILIIVGVLVIILSFFLGNGARSGADELERISISLHQETNGLKKRLKIVEEELMIGIGPGQQSKGQRPKQEKPVHEIIVNQILSLNAQGFSIEDIAKRASLTETEVLAVLRSKGVM